LDDGARHLNDRGFHYSVEEYTRLTKESYNRNALKYAEKFRGLLELQRRDAFPTFVSMLPGRRMLDLGCGAGDHALYFTKQGLSVTCVDIADEMVRLCRNKGLDAQVMDIEDLNLPKESYDGIWSVTSLLHIPKRKLPGVAATLYDLLVPSGILFVCVKEGGGERWIEEHGSRRFFAYWRADELDRTFAAFDTVKKERLLVGNTIFLEHFYRKPTP
jgi:SAM-dependent methyltransferase